MWSRGGDVIFLFDLMSCSIKFSLFFFTSTFLWKINRGCNYCQRERGQNHSFACGEGLRGQGEASKQRHHLPLSPLFRDEKLVSTIHQEKAQQMKLAPYLSGVREVHLLLVGSSVQNCQSYTPRAFLFLFFQSLKWCNHLKCSTEEDTEHKPQKIAARKEMKEGRNIQENDAPSPTHPYGQPAPVPRVSEKVTGLHACCGHGAEWRTRQLSAEEPEFPKYIDRPTNGQPCNLTWLLFSTLLLQSRASWEGQPGGSMKLSMRGGS